jgi:hypothetical protein
MARKVLPAAKQMTARLAKLQLDPGQHPQLAWLHRMHELSGFNTPALEAILLCAEHGLDFPQWLRKFLANGVRRHLHDRYASLDRSLGLKRGEGKPPDDQAYQTWRKRFDLVQHVHTLKAIHGLRKACEQVAGSTNRAYGMTADSLEREYKKHYRRLLMA